MSRGVVILAMIAIAADVVVLALGYFLGGATVPLMIGIACLVGSVVRLRYAGISVLGAVLVACVPCLVVLLATGPLRSTSGITALIFVMTLLVTVWGCVVACDQLQRRRRHSGL
jgi:hypothetical protein